MPWLPHPHQLLQLISNMVGEGTVLVGVQGQYVLTVALATSVSDTLVACPGRRCREQYSRADGHRLALHLITCKKIGACHHYAVTAAKEELRAAGQLEGA